jgi:hypothetical protein
VYLRYRCAIEIRLDDLLPSLVVQIYAELILRVFGVGATELGGTVVCRIARDRSAGTLVRRMQTRTVQQ